MQLVIKAVILFFIFSYTSFYYLRPLEIYALHAIKPGAVRPRLSGANSPMYPLLLPLGIMWLPTVIKLL